MNEEISFGQIVKDRRRALDLTQAELARRVACAAITIRKIEGDARRPSQQIAERLAMSLNVPLDERARFVRLARMALQDTPEPSPLPTPPPTPDEIGREDLSGRAIRGYDLGERIGAGGFGAVYRAVQPLIEREVAIKIILPQYADHPDFIRRFEAEAQLVARLEHPYIVPLYDYWREPGVAYLVMRLLRGGSLHSLLQNGPLPMETVAVLMEQVGAALHAAHRVGVIHRDLKPANVLLDEDGNGYLADFGIAKNLSDPDLEDLTQVGTMVGSPAYSSPEQIRSDPVRPQADIYCLGVLVYELLTGDKPFRGPTPVDYIMQHLNEPLPPLDGHTALDPVIRRATAKDPLERYSDVPSLLADFRQAVTGDSSVVLAVGEIPHRVDVADEDLENPYKGLRPFGEADAADFFGRETLVQELLTRLAEADDPAAGARQELGRFLAVVGPSGSGKSSVVKAGLIPALRQGGLLGSEDWFIVDLMPGAHPLEELEAALLRIAVNPPESLLTQLREDERGLLRAARRVLPADPSVELVLVIDQFEEVFTQVADEQVRTHLLDSLVEAVMDESSRVRVIVTLRADFTGRALEYVDFGELVRQRTTFVLPLVPEELEQAIIEPAVRSGLGVEPGLVATMVQDVGDQPGMLPLLQYALTELFERREGRTLMLAAYQESGGVTGALGRRAEELYVGLEDSAREAARQLFLRLVTLGEGVEDTRRRVLRTELSALQTSEVWETSEVLSGVIDLYGRYRLLTFDHDPVTRGPTVEVAHEALLREWGRLRGWLDESRADVRMQRLLAAAAAEWDEAEREPSYLLRGARLSQFEGWSEDSAVALTQDERSYLETSIAERQTRQAEEAERQQRELETAQRLAAEQEKRAEAERRRADVLKRGALALTGISLVAIVLAVVAFFARQQATQSANVAQAEAISRATAEAVAVAEREAAQAEADSRAAAEAIAVQERETAEWQARIATARELAAAAASNLEIDPERSILLALQAVNTTYTVDQTVLPEAETELRRAVSASHLLFTLDPGYGPGALGNVAFSPDGTRLATAAYHGAVTVWDAVTGQKLFTLSGTPSQGVAFSPDGTHLATVGGITRIWDAATGEELVKLGAVVSSEESPAAVAFSPDGTRLATIYGQVDHGKVLVWDVGTGRVSLTLLPTGLAEDVAFSPDGTRLVTVGEDAVIRIWDADNGEELFTLSGHTSRVMGVAFSPDGARLATSSADGTARVWDVSTLRQALGAGDDTALAPGEVAGQNTGVSTTLNTGVSTALNTDAAIGQELLRLTGHTDHVSDVAFSPDGTRLATASADGTARVWDLSTGKQLLSLAGHAAQVDAVAFSPDGTRLATTGKDGTAKVWDIAPDRELLSFASGAVCDMALSPDGTRLATSSDRGTATVWDASASSPTYGEELFTVSDRGHTRPLDVVKLSGGHRIASGVAFSPDGTRLATIGSENTATVWDTVTGRLLFTISPPQGVEAIAFSPDGALLVTIRESDSTTGGLSDSWDAATGQRVGSLTGRHLAVVSDFQHVVFSPDGTHLAITDDWGRSTIWDTATRYPVLDLYIDVAERGLTYATFNPDGTRLAVASWDEVVIIWDLETGTELLTLSGHTNSVNSVAYSPDGTRIATASADGTARVWDAETGEELIAISTYPIGVGRALFSADGTRLITANWDNTVRVYVLPIEELMDLARSRVTRSWKTEECQRFLHVNECPAEP